MINLLVALYMLAMTYAIGDHVSWETYWLASGSQATFAWDPVTHADPVVYEWENYSPVREAAMARGETAQTQVVTTVFSGHNIIKVRACVGQDEDRQCSEYAESIDKTNSNVDGAAAGWWLFGVIQKPGAVDTGT